MTINSCQSIEKSMLSTLYVCVQACSTDPSQQPPVTITVSEEEEGCTVSSNGRKQRAIPCCCLCVVYCLVPITVLQWDLSNLDTLGTEESVLISEVSSFQGL